MARAKGAYLYDIDGHQYIDYIGSWGPMIAGHANPDVRIAGIISPSAIATPAKGGITLNGKWSFNTGSQQSTWNTNAAVRPTDQIDAGVDGRLPTLANCSEGTEVIRLEPSIVAAAPRVETIECVEADPIPKLVGMVNQLMQACVVLLRPFARLLLPALFHLVPGIVPPAAVICWSFCQ